MIDSNWRISADPNECFSTDAIWRIFTRREYSIGKHKKRKQNQIASFDSCNNNIYICRLRLRCGDIPPKSITEAHEIAADRSLIQFAMLG